MISEFFLRVITDFSDYSDFLALALLVLVRKKIAISRYLFLYLMVNALLHALTIFVALQGKNNMWLYHIIGLSELVFIFLYFNGLFKLESRWWAFFVSVCTFYLIDSLYFTTLSFINNYGRSSELLFLLICCFYFFYRLYRDESIQEILMSIDFWISSGLIIYASGGFFGFLLSYESIFNEQNSWDFRYGTWIILALVQIAKALIISYGALHIYLTTKPKAVGSKSFLVL